MKPTTNDPRRIALSVLNQTSNKTVFCDDLLDTLLRNDAVSVLDKGLATEITYGVLKNLLFLDYHIKQFIKSPFNNIQKDIKNILRIAFYQLLFLNKIPEFAVVDEAVKMTKETENIKSTGFVNAVLRNFLRSKDSIELPKKEDDFVQYLSIKYSHPIWLVQYLSRNFSHEIAEEICINGNQTPPVCLRVNTLKISRDDFIDMLNKSGFSDYRVGEYSPDAVYIKRTGGLKELDIIKNGFASVQDESSQLVARILDPKPNEIIIDMCAAPGGKTTHIAELQGDQGKILAFDISKERLLKVKEYCHRLGIKSVSICEKTKEEMEKLGENFADKILVDAPCTGLGTIRRHPDLRWKKEKADIDNCQKLQIEILLEASNLLKTGGALVYSTCTYTREENEEIINNFLAMRREFKRDKIPVNNINSIKNFMTNSGYIKILPKANDIDGFFIARLRKEI